MNRKIQYLLITLLTACSIMSCRKPGIGGEAALMVTLEHHGNKMSTHSGGKDTVYIKFNATEFPGTSPSAYDTYFICQKGDDHIHCHGLKAGKYFLYGCSYDSVRMKRVTGGIAIKIAYQERKDAMEVHLAVTE